MLFCLKVLQIYLFHNILSNWFNCVALIGKFIVLGNAC